jgi:hypothetical protein
MLSNSLGFSGILDENSRESFGEAARHMARVGGEGVQGHFAFGPFNDGQANY